MSYPRPRGLNALNSAPGFGYRALALALFTVSALACSSDSKDSGGAQLGTPTNAGAGSTAGTAASVAGTGASGSTSTANAAGSPAPKSAAGASGGSTSSGAGGGMSASAAGSTAMTADAGMKPATDSAVTAGAGGMTAGGACTREMLATAVDSYYKALTAHDPKMVSTSASIKLTEDGKTIMLGEGLMKTAGMVKFTRSALDTTQCETATESVVVKGSDDYVVGTRLKVEAGQVTEIESILVGPDGWFPNPKAIVDSKTDDWEKPLLAEAERSPRDKLKKDIVDGYFLGVFGGKIPVANFPFASDCKRSENGFSPGACSFGVPTSMPMTPLHYVVDVEAGIAVGFVLFGGRGSGLDDFHMFHVKSGEVHAVHAVVGPTVMDRGWPSDPTGTP